MAADWGEFDVALKADPSRDKGRASLASPPTPPRRCGRELRKESDFKTQKDRKCKLSLRAISFSLAIRIPESRSTHLALRSLLWKRRSCGSPSPPVGSIAISPAVGERSNGAGRRHACALGRTTGVNCERNEAIQGNIERLATPGSPRRRSPSKDGRLSTPCGSQ